MDTFRIKKLPANDHNYLSSTQLLGYLKRKSKQLKACQQDPAMEVLVVFSNLDIVYINTSDFFTLVSFLLDQVPGDKMD